MYAGRGGGNRGGRDRIRRPSASASARTRARADISERQPSQSTQFSSDERTRLLLEVQQLKSDEEKCKVEKDHQNKRITELETEVKVKTETITTLKASKKVLNKAKGTLETRRTNLQQEKSNLQARITHLEDERSGWVEGKKNFKALKKEKKEWKKKLEEAEKKAGDAGEKIKILEKAAKEREEADEKARVADTAVEESRKSTDEVKEKKLIDLDAEKTSLRQELDKINILHTESLFKLDKANKEVDRIESEKKAVEKAASERVKERVKEKVEWDNREKELERKVASLQTTASTLNSANNTISNLRRDADMIVSRLQVDVANRNGRISTLESNAFTLQTALDNFRSLSTSIQQNQTIGHCPRIIPIG